MNTTTLQTGTLVTTTTTLTLTNSDRLTFKPDANINTAAGIAVTVTLRKTITP
jgi:hypothetical protein